MTDYKAPLTSRKLLMELKLPLKFCSVYLRYSATVMRVSERYKDSYTVGLCVFFLCAYNHNYTTLFGVLK